jgi:hypothetical protein
MTTTEIKKLYTKTKKAVEKKTGDKFTWVMNGRQQMLGTATVCVASSWDTVANVRTCRKRIESGDVKKKAAESWQFYKREAEVEAAEEAAGAKHYNSRFWRDKFDLMGSEEEYIAKELKKANDRLNEYENTLETRGDQANQVKTAHEYARQLIASQEIQSFLNAIGGSATIEDKTENDGFSILTYIRFHYKADDVIA